VILLSAGHPANQASSFHDSLLLLLQFDSHRAFCCCCCCLPPVENPWQC